MKKRSLVIGINEYLHFTNLDNCVKDAKDIHLFLESVGFESQVVIDVDQKELIRKISEFKESITEDSISLIYFSGHGLQDDKYNYIATSDSEVTINEEIKYNCILADELLIGREKNLHILILDACRNNPFKDGKKGLSIGLLKMDAPSGTLIAFSTSPHGVSIERQGDSNGIYTKHLLQNLKVPNVPVEIGFKNTRKAVMEDTDNRQVPWEESSLIGDDFSFVKERIQFKDVELGLNSWIEGKEIKIHDFMRFLDEPFFSECTIEELQLVLSLVKIQLTKEQSGETKRTADEDYVNDELIDRFFPNFQERVISECGEYDNLTIETFKDIEIVNCINYGFNFLNEPEDSFPQLFINEVKFNNRQGILSFYTSIEDKEHFLKPLFIEKVSPITFFKFNIIKGDAAESILSRFFEIRKPFEPISEIISFDDEIDFSEE